MGDVALFKPQMIRARVVTSVDDTLLRYVPESATEVIKIGAGASVLNRDGIGECGGGLVTLLQVR